MSIGQPITSRRNFLVRASAIPVAGAAVSVPIITAAALVSSSGQQDEEVLTLANKILELHQKAEKAERVADDTLDKFYEYSKQRPEALYSMRHDGKVPGVKFEHDPALEGRTRNCWCRVDDIDRLRAFVAAPPPTSSEFIGTADEWEAFAVERHRLWLARKDPDDDFDPPHDPHLWVDVPDTDLHDRAAQILHAWESYQADRNQYKADVDLERLSDYADELFDQLNELHAKLRELRAVTLEGFRAKALVVAHACWGGAVIRDWDSHDHRLAASLIADLTGL